MDEYVYKLACCREQQRQRCTAKVQISSFSGLEQAAPTVTSSADAAQQHDCNFEVKTHVDSVFESGYCLKTTQESQNYTRDASCREACL